MIGSTHKGGWLFSMRAVLCVSVGCFAVATVCGQGNEGGPGTQPADSGPRIQSAPVDEPPTAAPGAGSQPASTLPAAAPPSNSREMLRRLGVEDRTLDGLSDGSPVAPAETETVLRVLLRLRTFPRPDLQRWARDDRQLAEAAMKPEAARGDVFQIRGRVIAVEACRLDKEVADRFDMPLYYRCRIEMAEVQAVVDVYAEKIPKDWQEATPTEANAGAIGIFLKCADREAGHPVFVLAASRVAWYPDVPLANAGMDFGLLDDVEDGKPVSGRERDAFYSILSIAGQTKPGQLLRQADAALSKSDESFVRVAQDGKRQYAVAPLFNEPKTQRGRLISVSGTVRRIEKILVDDPEMVALYGLDHYYQIAIFTDDSQRYPLFFCVRELPKGMPYGNLPEYSEGARIAGFFLKTWSYALPPLAGQKSKTSQKQQAPLLIGRDVAWSAGRRPAADGSIATIAIVAGVAGLMIAIWIGVLRGQKEERQWIDRVTPDHPQLDAIPDLDKISSHRDDRPDFSRLAEMDRGPDEVASVRDTVSSEKSTTTPSSESAVRRRPTAPNDRNRVG